MEHQKLPMVVLAVALVIPEGDEKLTDVLLARIRRTEKLSVLRLPIKPFDRKMEQVLHDFIIDLHIFFCLIFQTRDNV